MATKKYLDQQGLQTLIQGLKAKNDILYAAAGHAHAASEISYANANIKGGADIKVDEALNVLVANVVRATEDLSTTEGNVKVLEKAINDLKAQIGEGTVADKIQVVQTALDNFKAAQATKNQEQDAAIGAAQGDATQAITDAAAAQATANGATTAVAKAQGEIDALELVVGDENSGLVKKVNTLEGASHTHTNKAELDKFVTGDKAALDNAVAKVTGDADTEGTIAEAKKAGTDAAKAEADRAKGVEAGLQTAIDAINNETTGILAQAKTYADGKNAAIEAAQAAAEAAQADVDVLKGKVGEVPADKTVVELIADAKKAGTDAAAAVTAEQQRATGIEQGLRTDVDTNKDAINILNGDVKVEGSVDKKIKDAIDQVNTAAGTLEGRVKANENAIKVINGEGEGSIKKAVADLVNGAPEAMNTLKELADSITTHQSAYDAYVAQVAKDIAAAKQAAIDKAGKLDTTLHTTIAGEIATAKQEAIEAAATKDTALENKLQANIDKKVDKSVYDTKVAELVAVDAANLKDAKAYADQEDAKIEAILGHKAIDGGEGATGLCADVAANAAAIVAETTARQNADKLLSDRIAKFEGNGKGSVAAQVKAVADDLKAHKKAQVVKEKAVDDKLAVIQGADTVDGSIAKALKDAKAYTDTKFDDIGALTAEEINSMLDTVYGTQA